MPGLQWFSETNAVNNGAENQQAGGPQIPSKAGGLWPHRVAGNDMNIFCPMSAESMNKFRRAGPEVKRIKKSEEFHELYDLGELVMPVSTKTREVRHARRCSDGSQVVVKIMWKPACFMREQDELDWRLGTELMLNLPEHAGVSCVHEVLESSEAFYVVTECCKGMDLYDFRTQRTRSMRPALVKEIIRQLLEALDHLHSHGLVHKDVKQENIMIDPTALEAGNPDKKLVKLIDFDNVCPVGHVPIDVLGTNQYISQEAYGGLFSPRSDVFAAGVVAYRLLAGKFPYDKKIFDDRPGENKVGSPKMIEIRQKVLKATINWEAIVFQMFPQALDLVQKMLTQDAGQRPAAHELLQHAWMKSS